MHLLDDQEHNRYHTTLVDWLPSHSTIDQWLAASQGMSTLEVYSPVSYYQQP